MNRWVELEERHGSGAYGKNPITLAYGKGTRVWDTEGKEYIDCGTGIGVAALGHANPEITKAVSDQCNLLLTCHNAYYSNEVRARFLEKLIQITPDGLNRVFLSNSGTESIEAAIKLARSNKQSYKIVVAKRGFHGRTFGSLSASWKNRYRKPFEPLVPGFIHVPFGNVEELSENVTEDTAAVLLEPVQGEAGVYPAPEGYLQKVRRLCDESGTLLIFDEVQTGMGRTGKWFAFEHFGVTPDILCLAKSLGGGIPIGATIFRSDLSFEKGQHGSTFGGNPMACRAGTTVIDMIHKHQILDNVSQVGYFFLEGLRNLKKRNPSVVREVRGLGLMLAMQLRQKVSPVLLNLAKAGVLALAAGRTTIRFLPPLIIHQMDVEEVLEVLEGVLT